MLGLKKYIEAVSALVFSNHRILLVKRGQDPMRGLWSLPGGKVRKGENHHTAIRRELQEETGQSIGQIDFFTKHKIDVKGEDGKNYHFIIHVFICESDHTEVTAASDVDDAQFVALDQLDQFELTPNTFELIKKAIQPKKKHSLKGHLKTVLIAIAYGLGAYGFLYGLMKLLKYSGFQSF